MIGNPYAILRPETLTVDGLLSKKGRQTLLSLAWLRVCDVLSEIEDQETLSSKSRLLLQVCLGHTPQFVDIILCHFYKKYTFDRLLYY